MRKNTAAECYVPADFALRELLQIGYGRAKGLMDGEFATWPRSLRSGWRCCGAEETACCPAIIVRLR